MNPTLHWQRRLLRRISFGVLLLCLPTLLGCDRFLPCLPGSPNRLLREFYHESDGAHTEVEDGAFPVTAYAYNVRNELKSITEGVCEEATAEAEITNKRETTYTYDPLTGAKTSETRTDKRKKVYTYLDNGKQDLVTLFQDTTKVNWRQYTYNPLTWELASVSTKEGVVYYEHDQWGQITRLSNSRGQSLRFSYDRLGNRTATVSESVATGTTERTTYDYDPNTARRSAIHHPNGASIHYTYDARGNKKTITHKESNGREALKLEYTRDKRGIITDLVETRWDEVAQGYQVVNWTHAYDPQKRLTGSVREVEGHPEATTTYAYTYDAAGNRLTKTIDAVTTTYTYNSLNQLITDGTTEHFYDVYGNLETEKV